MVSLRIASSSGTSTGGRNAASAPQSRAVIVPMVLDYTMVVLVCVTLAFWVGVLVDGHLVHPFKHAEAEKKSSLHLFAEIAMQFTMQGLIAWFVTFAVRSIPSPFQGWLGYSYKDAGGMAVRGPALVLFSIVLLTVSSSLQARVTYLISRFDKNTCPVRSEACPKA